MADLNQACRKSLFIIFMDQKACEAAVSDLSSDVFFLII